MRLFLDWKRLDHVASDATGATGKPYSSVVAVEVVCLVDVRMGSDDDREVVAEQSVVFKFPCTWDNVKGTCTIHLPNKDVH